MINIFTDSSVVVLLTAGRSFDTDCACDHFIFYSYPQGGGHINSNITHLTILVAFLKCFCLVYD